MLGEVGKGLVIEPSWEVPTAVSTAPASVAADEGLEGNASEVDMEDVAGIESQPELVVAPSGLEASEGRLIEVESELAGTSSKDVVMVLVDNMLDGSAEPTSGTPTSLVVELVPTTGISVSPAVELVMGDVVSKVAAVDDGEDGAESGTRDDELADNLVGVALKFVGTATKLVELVLELARLEVAVVKGATIDQMKLETMETNGSVIAVTGPLRVAVTLLPELVAGLFDTVAVGVVGFREIEDVHDVEEPCGCFEEATVELRDCCEALSLVAGDDVAFGVEVCVLGFEVDGFVLDVVRGFVVLQLLCEGSREETLVACFVECNDVLLCGLFVEWEVCFDEVRLTLEEDRLEGFLVTTLASLSLQDVDVRLLAVLLGSVTVTTSVTSCIPSRLSQNAVLASGLSPRTSQTASQVL